MAERVNCCRFGTVVRTGGVLLPTLEIKPWHGGPPNYPVPMGAQVGEAVYLVGVRELQELADGEIRVCEGCGAVYVDHGDQEGDELMCDSEGEGPFCPTCWAGIMQDADKAAPPPESED